MRTPSMETRAAGGRKPAPGTPTVETEYRLSERVVLRPGDQFRVSAGPYYRLASGEKLPMAARGVMTFVAVHRKGRRVLVEARAAGEGTVILHVEGRRRSPVEGIVPRPYRIRGRVGTKKSKRVRKSA